MAVPGKEYTLGENGADGEGVEDCVAGGGGGSIRPLGDGDGELFGVVVVEPN
jgi:hypothetical protein